MTVNATSARSVNLTWGPPNRDQQNGIIRYYLISLQSVAGTTARNVSSVQWSISISGLRPYTLYNCTVQAETVGLGPPNSIIQISTPEDGKIYICVLVISQVNSYSYIHRGKFNIFMMTVLIYFFQSQLVLLKMSEHKPLILLYSTFPGIHQCLNV